ncbi:hypothetical protein ABZ840_26905 [Streptomyces sp. NPDC047117]|uniref:hypothetical protein n=1 Tax=Streptomyces sp. NPDC047117 TaxID=3155379 RepID=UPI0033F34B6F
MTGAARNHPGGRLRLHVIAPHIAAADLAAGVSRVLTGRDSPPTCWHTGTYGQVVRSAGVTAELTAAWDGPELRLTCEDARSFAPRAGQLLAEIAAAAAGAGTGRPSPASADRPADPPARPGPPTKHGPPARPGPNRDSIAYRAWEALMAYWEVPGAARAEIVAPGVLAAPDALGEPLFVFDHVGPPVPPAGWLLRSWYAPDTGVHHFSAPPSPAGPRLKVGSPRPAERKRAAELLRTWRALTAELTAAPGSPLAALPVPPLRCVLGERHLSGA